MELFKEYQEKTIVAHAEFSKDRKYRYRLTRIWNHNKPMALCIGLNPSTANEEKNDPTIRHLMQVLERLGYGGFYMMNLYSFVTSKPEVLFQTVDPIGPSTARFLRESCMECVTTIFCWGSFKGRKTAVDMMQEYFDKADVKCFGQNKDGMPMHPMSLMYTGQLKTATLKDYLPIKF